MLTPWNMLLSAVFLSVVLLHTTRVDGHTTRVDGAERPPVGISIGDACTNNTFCNYEGVGAIYHTKCDSSTCECTMLYYGDSGDTVCLQASLGDDCSGKSDGDAFCRTSDANAECASNACACASGYYEIVSLVDGYDHCAPITIGSPCDPSGSGSGSSGGTALCQTGASDLECNTNSETCECPDGETYDKTLNSCDVESFAPACDTCRNTGGHCYEMASVPFGCSCPAAKNSSAADGTGSLATGCDLGLAHIGDYCDSDGSAIKCVDDNSVCRHAGELDGRFSCECIPGYYKIPLGINFHCYRSIVKETDQNCKWCQNRGGICYDIDEDDIRDGCLCPGTKSSSDLHDPSKDCETNHVQVTCTATEMQIRYTPHDTARYPDMATKLTNKDSYVYIDRHLGQDPCRFEPDSSDWIVDLKLGSSQVAACGTTVTYPTHRHINYNNWLVLQMKAVGRSSADATVHVYCQYDTTTHTFTDSGSQVIGFASVASEGEEVHPVLTMEVEDEFGRDATVQGIRLGQPARLIIEMTDDRSGVYHSIKPEVCIASNRPELADPVTTSILLLYDGCPVEDSYLSVRNMFYPDPADAELSQTGLFPMFQFEDTDFVFFHCAVKVCRNDDNCDAPTCSTRRKRRAVASDVTNTVQESGTRPTAFTSLTSGAVTIKKDSKYGGRFIGNDQTQSSKLPRNYVLIISIGAGVMITVIVVAAAVGITKRRRSRPTRRSRNIKLISPTPSV